MIPMRFSSVFKSRWLALLWAAGILWFAYDFADSAPQQPQANSSSDQVNPKASADDANKVAEVLGS